MTRSINIVDSHVHLDLIERYHPNRIQWLKDSACGVISWAYIEGIHSVSQIEDGLKSIAESIQKYSDAGLTCCFLAGVHPRSIPRDLKPVHIDSLLKGPLENPLCKGMGEIGLETGDTREQEILIAQLDFGQELLKRGKVIGIHTPRSNKHSITATTLKILARFPDISSSVVIDHCTLETIRPVLDAGFRAGVTLSPAKTSWEEMKHIALKYSNHIDRIMCNTDSGSEFFEDLVLLSRSPELPEAVLKKIFYENAFRFFSM